MGRRWRQTIAGYTRSIADSRAPTKPKCELACFKTDASRYSASPAPERSISDERIPSRFRM
jgi:hypothetical protein